MPTPLFAAGLCISPNSVSSSLISVKFRGVKGIDIFRECQAESSFVPRPLVPGPLVPTPSLLPLRVDTRMWSLRKSGLSVARDDALSARPISTVLQIARSVKL